MKHRTIPRREFLKGSAGGGVAAGAILRGLASPAPKRVPPSDQIVLGCIGMGRQGMYNMSKFREHAEVRVAAVCDVYQPHLERARQETSAQAHKDFREVLDRSDIDAVLVSTPDHWHALMTVLACQAGKDVYVEKPVSVTISEGRRMVEAARRHERIVQVGTQQRSGLHFQHATEIIQKGDIGKVSVVRTWNFGNNSPVGIGNPPDSEPPSDLDWDLWLGPAPLVPFNPNRFGVHPERWSTFRYFWDYAGGMMTDWGVHLLDIVEWAMKVEGPVAVTASGGNWTVNDNRETPDTLTATLEYPNFICTYENRSGNGRSINEHGYGIEFYGTKGTLFLDRGGFEIIPEHFRRDDRNIPRMYSMQSQNSNDHNHDHVRNFLNCIKSRAKPVSDIEIGHRSTATCLLANIAYRTGRKIGWNAATEEIREDPAAAALLQHQYRSPWQL